MRYNIDQQDFFQTLCPDTLPRLRELNSVTDIHDTILKVPDVVCK